MDQPPLSLIFELDQVVTLRQQIKGLQVDEKTGSSAKKLLLLQTLADIEIENDFI
jgi:hypothetical protein